jgi:hypothetical protein
VFGVLTKGGTPNQWLERKTLAQSNLSLAEQKDLVVFMEALTARVALEATTSPNCRSKKAVG